MSTLTCPSCAEMNAPDETRCCACGARLVEPPIDPQQIRDDFARIMGRRPSVFDDPAWVAADNRRWLQRKLREELARGEVVAGDSRRRRVPKPSPADASYRGER